MKSICLAIGMWLMFSLPAISNASIEMHQPAIKGVVVAHANHRPK